MMRQIAAHSPLGRGMICAMRKSCNKKFVKICVNLC